MQTELIEECLSYIEQLTNFLKDKDYWIDDYDAHLASLRQKYATFKLGNMPNKGKDSLH
jgi:hypothetical protein